MNASTALSYELLSDADGARAVAISLGALELTRYTFRADDPQQDSPRPFFFPVRTTRGDDVAIYRPHDHVWHKGIAWSLPHLGDDNFWGGPSFRRGRDYEWLPNNGAMEHRALEAVGIADGVFTLTHALVWRTQAGAEVVQERRTIAVVPGAAEGAWTLLFSSAMTNISGADIAIGSPTTQGRPNAGYGGLFWRGPRSFTGGAIVGPGGLGGEELRGQRAPWLAFTGRHDDSCRDSTVLMVDDVRNASHPPEWFTRSEPFACMGPAPFFSAEVTFAAGDTLQHRYAVVVLPGQHDAATLETLAADATTVLRQHLPAGPA